MLRKIILVLAAVFCLTVSNTSAMARYFGVTDTVKNVIQLLAKESESSVMYQAKVHTESNAEKQGNFNNDNMVMQQEMVSTDSNAAESMQPYTDSNAERL